MSHIFRIFLNVTGSLLTFCNFPKKKNLRFRTMFLKYLLSLVYVQDKIFWKKYYSDL